MKIRGTVVFLCALALAVAASAQTKVSGTATCKADPMTPVEVGDAPGHMLGVQKANCTWQGLEIAGSAAKDGVSVANIEVRGNNGTSRGYHTGTVASGDQVDVQLPGKVRLEGRQARERLGNVGVHEREPENSRASRARARTRERPTRTGR